MQLGCGSKNAYNSAGRCRCSLRAPLAILLFATLGTVGVEAAQSQNWLSGQDSPTHDDDRRTPLSGKTVVLEDEDVRASFEAQQMECNGVTRIWRIVPPLCANG
jgi:hypothetical protein